MPSSSVLSPLTDAANEIRLLHLDSIFLAAHTASFFPVLIGCLERVSLLKDVDYNALSHVWWDPPPVSQLRIDDETRLSIDANYLDAVMHIFRTDTEPVGILIALRIRSVANFCREQSGLMRCVSIKLRMKKRADKCR